MAYFLMGKYFSFFFSRSVFNDAYNKKEKTLENTYQYSALQYYKHISIYIVANSSNKNLKKHKQWHHQKKFTHKAVIRCDNYELWLIFNHTVCRLEVEYVSTYLKFTTYIFGGGHCLIDTQEDYIYIQWQTLLDKYWHTMRRFSLRTGKSKPLCIYSIKIILYTL